MAPQARKTAVICKTRFYQGESVFKTRLDFEKSAVCIDFVVMPQEKSHRRCLWFFLYTVGKREKLPTNYGAQGKSAGQSDFG